MRAPTVLVLAVAMALGCADQPTTPSTMTDGVGLAPAFTFIKNPDNGNPHIYRFESDVFYLIFQFPSGPPPAGTPDLVAVHSTTPDCGGGLEPADIQQVIENPDDPASGKIRELTLADPINIFIVDLSQPGSCFGFELVASGEGKLVNTDNDVLVFLRDSNNANAFGFTAHGQLYGPDGRMAHYNGASKVTWDGNDGSKFFHTNEHFNFKWTGKGK